MLILLNLLRVMWPNVGTRQAFCMCFLKNKVPRSPICFAVFQFVPPCVLGYYSTDLLGLNVAPPFSTFMCLCIVTNFFLIKPTDALISQIYFVKKLRMFRAVPLPFIRSFPLHIRHWYMTCRSDESLQARPGWNCLKHVDFLDKINLGI